MTDESPSSVCLVCGYPGLDEPPYDEHGCSSFEICPCCGTEFGYDDHATAHKILRHKWIGSGRAWWSTIERPPESWDADIQLQDAGFE